MSLMNMNLYRSSKPLILLKSDLFRMGGAEKIAQRLGTAFSEKGTLVTLLTTGPIPSSLPFKTISHQYKNHLSFLKVCEYDRFCQNFISKQKDAVIFGLDRNRFQTHLRASNGVHAAYLEFRGKIEGPWKK